MSQSGAVESLPRRNPSPLVLTRSKALLERARSVIPGTTLSMMKRPEHFAPGEFPVFLSHGRGALVEDADGNEFVDFICGLGATSLGHQHPALLDAARSVLESGFIHSLPVSLEVSAAELLVDTIPGAEMARFFKTGADATSAAVRLARAITSKERIITVGYNGWHDHFMFDTPGVPSALAAFTRRMPLFTPADEAPLLEAIAQDGPNLAALLLSVPYNRPLSKEFLQSVRRACTAHGVLLVFDEIVTGFRLALGGAHQYFDVKADIACFSKSLAAGMPLSAVVGPREHLKVMDTLQVSTTFGGELLSLAVCEAALNVYRSTDYIARLAKLGGTLRDGINAAATVANAPLRVLGYDSIPLFSFDRDPARHVPLMRHFQAKMAERGVLLRRDLNFINGAHTEAQVAFTVEAAAESLAAMRRSDVFDT
jgi:aminotransferase MxcL